jgi:hypothetical protein
MYDFYQLAIPTRAPNHPNANKRPIKQTNNQINNQTTKQTEHMVSTRKITKWQGMAREYT